MRRKDRAIPDAAESFALCLVAVDIEYITGTVNLDTARRWPSTSARHES
ncbi:MAG: hypothetical protein NUW23_09065 [Firmicutes bacterium]|nr:hypothetical protein [Bacillota bacterium]